MADHPTSPFDQIQQLVAQEKTAEALRVFAQTGLEPDTSALLQAQYDDLQKWSALGKVSPELQRITINRIHFALLHFCGKEEPIETTSLRAPLDNHAAAEGEKQPETLSRQGSQPGVAASQKLSFAEAKPQIRAQIRSGNTAQALALLARTGTPEAAALGKRFAAARKSNALGMTGVEDWCLEQLRLFDALLSLDWMRDDGPPRGPDKAIKTQILQLVQHRKTEQALALCEGLGDRYLLLQAQFRVAQKQAQRGLMESEYLEATRSKIHQALEEWLGEAPGPERPSGGLLRNIKRLFG